MPVTLYHLLDHPELVDPLMIVALDAWVDAGSAATSAAALLAEEGTPIAGIDARTSPSSSVNIQIKKKSLIWLVCYPKISPTTCPSKRYQPGLACLLFPLRISLLCREPQGM